jgi:hypothetical protein
MLDLVVAGASVGLWLVAYAACRVATRPVTPAAGPATMDLGPEPPAVVSLLANGWSTSVDTAESTVLDLAAAGHYELRQPDADPYRTTVHLTPQRAAGDALRPYEQQVLDRIRALAVDGVVPLTALTFRDENESRAWNKRLRAAVVADARAAGLSERRFGRTTMTALYAGALAAGLVCGTVGVHHTHVGWTFLLFITVAGVLAGLVQNIGERGTPAGLAAASRWFGVRTWLRNHEQFADLPPSAVAVWDRYLAYGAALGVTRRASAVLDLEVGTRRKIWSSYRGAWRRIRIRYPWGVWYGSKTGALVVQALLCLVAGTLVVRAASPASLPAVAGWALLTGGVGLLIRALADLTRSVSVTGEVLARRTWRSRNGHPMLDYLVIDDRAGERTTAWGLPPGLGDHCHEGAVVTITARPWSRRVRAVTQHSPGRPRPPAAEDPAPIIDIFGEVREAPAGPLPVSADDVARLVGQPVRVERRPQRVQFRSARDNSVVLRAEWAAGTAGRIAWRANARGVKTPLPGIGDEAYASGNHVVLRAGDITLVLTAVGSGRIGTPHLPWLLTRCERAALTLAD